jgi:plasmid stabilization system protein ParE
MIILILPSAQYDLSEGFDFYERQEEGLGNYFQESLFSDVESLRLYAGIHHKQFGYYRLLSNRFPYAVYYDQERLTVRVWAVLDCRRDPSEIRKKLAALRKK